MNKKSSPSPIIKDKLSIEAFKSFNYASSCEDCSHFDFGTTSCTFGFPVEEFLKIEQLRSLEESGEMAFCRAIEID